MKEGLQAQGCFKWTDFFRDSDFPLQITMVRDAKAMAPPHTHDFFELLLVVSGTGIYVTSSGEYQLEQGDFFLVPPGDVHGFSNQHHLQIYNILWKANELRFDFQELEKHPGYHLFFYLEPNARESNQFKGHLNLDKKQLQIVQDLIKRLHDELKARVSGYELLARALLAELFVMICRFCVSGSEDSSNLLQIAQVVNFMRSNYAKALKRASLARMVNMSEATFFRHFKAATGVSPMEYLVNLRLSKAEELLRTTALPLMDIAIQCGFYDSNYFGALFRKHYNITPCRYRRLFK